MPKVVFKKTEYPYSFSEEIKQIRTNIEYSSADNKVVMFTSSTSGEGKSTLIYEVCKSFAELDKKVLLIDADMRKSMFHTLVDPDCQKPRGLSYYLSGQSELDNVLCETDTPNLSCILAGRVPPNPSELLTSERMKTLMAYARENYDLVFVDCPPMNIVVDSSIIAADYADSSIVVVKAGKIPRKVVQNVIKELEKVKCPIIGVVLNQVKENSRGYYKKYGYGSDYYGHADEAGNWDKASQKKAKKSKKEINL